MQVCPPSCSKCLPTAPLRSCSEHHSGIFPHQPPLHLVPQTLFLKHSQKSHFVPHISGGWTHLSFTQELHWWVIPKRPRIPANIVDAFLEKTQAQHCVSPSADVLHSKTLQRHKLLLPSIRSSQKENKQLKIFTKFSSLGVVRSGSCPKAAILMSPWFFLQIFQVL